MTAMPETERYVLAFDASCGTCRDISSAVSAACDGRLEILPLAHPGVERWRTAVLGAEPPWAPTLLAVRGDDVRAWVGRRMAPALLRRLGPRATVRVLQSLGQLRVQAAGRPLSPVGRPAVGRAAFLRAGGGLLVAGGVVLLGRTPAFAEQARTWAENNPRNLPRRYAEYIKYPTAYRRAVFERLTPSEKAALWTEHVKAWRVAHPHLTARQTKALEEIAASAAKPASHDPALRSPRELNHIKDVAVEAFGREEAKALGVTLGPAPSSLPAGTDPRLLSGCTCNREDDWCGLAYHCRLENGATCDETSSGCGWWGGQRCNGLCYD
ncbi:bacteriocin fulvocin C-related protein [Streptomyces beigongshangae]|uniref:bacteriocin fulvocin C-related protein n=1 Tax=Streptomyces beigongshangae TaxID=2841597 RepID=UPI001C84A1BB|nr:bacteriocin fulvocin C-related protein [Streptomyces sp. REN17]